MRRPSGRAERRHHRERMVTRTMKLMPWWITTREHAVRLADNRKPCSCWMCGNQRKHHGPTFQEVKAKMTF